MEYVMGVIPNEGKRPEMDASRTSNISVMFTWISHIIWREIYGVPYQPRFSRLNPGQILYE